MKTKRTVTTFHIVRHGQTKWNVERRMQGHMDSPLTEEGMEQARELSKLFAPIQFDAVFSSDVLRAQRTAQIIAAEKKMAVTTTKLLRESFMGRFEGEKLEYFLEQLRDQIDEHEKLVGQAYLAYKLASDMESAEESIARFITFLRETAVAYEGKNILVVSHANMMRSLLIHLGFGDKTTLPHGCVKNLAIITLESDGTDFFVTQTQGIQKVES